MKIVYIKHTINKQSTKKVTKMLRSIFALSVFFFITFSTMEALIMADRVKFNVVFCIIMLVTVFSAFLFDKLNDIQDKMK